MLVALTVTLLALVLVALALRLTLAVSAVALKNGAGPSCAVWIVASGIASCLFSLPLAVASCFKMRLADS